MCKKFIFKVLKFYIKFSNFVQSRIKLQIMPDLCDLYLIGNIAHELKLFNKLKYHIDYYITLGKYYCEHNYPLQSPDHNTITRKKRELYNWKTFWSKVKVFSIKNHLLTDIGSVVDHRRELRTAQLWVNEHLKIIILATFRLFWDMSK